MRKHATEKEVITALSFLNGSSSRKAAWHKLRSRRNYHHNMTVMDVGKGNLIVAQKLNQSDLNVGSDDFLPFRHCRELYRRQELWKHEHGCKIMSDREQTRQPKAGTVQFQVDAFYRIEENVQDASLCVGHNAQ